jgi:hypothetical protein
MQLTMLTGYPDNVGRRHIWAGYGNGPANYQQAAKDPLAQPRFQFYFDTVFPAVTTSGTYIVYGIASGVGARLEWTLKWVVAATGAEVANGTNLSAQHVQLGGFGGQF